MLERHILLSISAPRLALNLFLNDFLEVNPFIELVCFGTRVADPSFGIELFCYLANVNLDP